MHKSAANLIVAVCAVLAPAWAARADGSFEAGVESQARLPTGGSLQYGPGESYKLGFEFAVAPRAQLRLHLAGGEQWAQGADFHGIYVAPLAVGYILHPQRAPQVGLSSPNEVEPVVTLVQLEYMTGEASLAYHTQASAALGWGIAIHWRVLQLIKWGVSFGLNLTGGFDSRYFTFQSAGLSTGTGGLAMGLVGGASLGARLEPGSSL